MRQQYEFSEFNRMNLHGRDALFRGSGLYLESNGSGGWNYSFDGSLHEFVREFEDDDDIKHRIVIEGEPDKGIRYRQDVRYSVTGLDPDSYDPSEELEQLEEALTETEQDMADENNTAHYTN